MLISLRRFPSALTTSVASIESVFESSGRSELSSRVSLQRKFSRARDIYVPLQAFCDGDLESLRTIRNRFEHEGFSPKDDNTSVRLLLDLALPYLECCFKAIHEFGLFGNLHPTVTQHLMIAGTVRKLAAALPETDLSYCFDAFGHCMRYEFEHVFSTTSQFKSGEEHFKLVLERKAILERKFTCEWVFDCPICDWPGGVVCELNNEKLADKEIKAVQMACASCQFFVPETIPC